MNAITYGNKSANDTFTDEYKLVKKLIKLLSINNSMVFAGDYEEMLYYAQSVKQIIQDIWSIIPQRIANNTLAAKVFDQSSLISSIDEILESELQTRKDEVLMLISSQVLSLEKRNNSIIAD